MPLSDIVDVTISTQTQAVPIPSFGLPMILGTSKSFTDLIRQYSSLQGVAVDFAPNTAEYIASQAIFSQKSSPTSIFIGRRQADTVSINVVSPQSNQTYQVIVNGQTASVNSGTIAQVITVNLSTAVQSTNLINVVFNNVVLGTINSIINFDINFVSLNSIVATVNGVALAPDVFTTDQATTIGLVATKIATAAGVASATVTGTKQITVVFTSPGANTVNSVVTTLGATQPVATILQGGFPFDGTSATTLGDIATAILAQPHVTSATVSLNSIIVTSTAGQLNNFNQFTIMIGTLPVVTILNSSEASTIGLALVAAINALGQPVTATYVGTPSGNFTVTATVPGTPYTLTVASSIIVPSACYVEVTQVIPVETYTVTLNGVPYSFTTDDNPADNAFIALQLVNAINANTANSGISAINNADGSFNLTSANVFSIFANPQLFAVVIGLQIAPLVATDVVATTLTNILNVNNNWYGFILTDRTKATVEAAMTWAQGQTVLFGTASNDLTIINSPIGTDVSSIAWFAQTNQYQRTFVMYHQDAATTYPEAAWMGLVFTMTPGSETWKFKTLFGVGLSNLTTTQSNTALSKNANTYEYIGGVGITQNGTTSQGEFIDIVRGIDWLTSTIQNNVFAVLVKSPKIPYTDAGISVIQAQVQMSLEAGVANNFLTDNPAPLVTVPLAANVAPNDKANRILRNVNFTAYLAGAIHVVQIKGTVIV